MFKRIYVLIIALCYGFAVALRPDDFPMPVAHCLKYTNTSGDTYNGTLDQRTYTTWKNMKIVKRKVTGIANPQSSKQMAVRNGMSNAIVLWKTLGEPEKALWETLAHEPQTPNPEQGVRAIIRRSTSPQSGLNCFVGHNQRIVELGGIMISVPAIELKPVPVASITPTFLGAVLTVAWSAVPAPEADDYVRVWIVSRTAGIVHKQMVMAALSSLETAASDQYYGGLGVLSPFSNIVGTELYLQVDVVSQATGKFSVPSMTKVVTVA